MNTTMQCFDERVFSGLLKSNFISDSVPEKSDINCEIEELKEKAGRLALTIFDLEKKDVTFASGRTFGNIFSQDIYGAGFTKGLSIILAYSICLEESRSESRSEAVITFAAKIQEITQNIFQRISSGDCKLSEVRKLAEQLDNYGGYYQRTQLSAFTAKTVISEGILRCPLEIDSYSGHLVAKVPLDLSQQLLDAYRSEIETYITDEGKKNLKLPYNIGFVAIAYKDELSSSKEKIESLLSSGKQVELSFKVPYIIPVRGDNRYSLVASVLIESPTITTIRSEMKLAPLYSEGRPLRYTFGAVHSPHLDYNNDSLIQKMRKCSALEPWMRFIDKHMEKNN